MKTRKEKIEKHLPSLLIDYKVDGSDSLYQKKRNQISQLKRNNPSKLNSLLTKIEYALTEVDIYLDHDVYGGEIRTRKRKHPDF